MMVVGLCSPKRCTGPQGLACLGRRHDKTKGLCCGRQLSDQSTARRVMAVVQGLLQNEHRQAEKDLAFASPQVWRLRDQQRPTEASVSSSTRVCLVQNTCVHSGAGTHNVALSHVPMDSIKKATFMSVPPSFC